MRRWMVFTRIGSSPWWARRRRRSPAPSRGRAMATRLRMPPEISRVLVAHATRRPGRASPRRAGRSPPHHLRLLVQGNATLSRRTWSRRGLPLEDDAVAPAHRLEAGAPEAGDVRPSTSTAPRVGTQETQEVFEEHRLAAAAPADDDHDLARATSRSTPRRTGCPPKDLPSPWIAGSRRTEPRK